MFSSLFILFAYSIITLSPFSCQDDLIFPSNKTKLIFHWEDDFSIDEKQKIVTWIEATKKAVDESIGAYPFDIYVHIKRRENAREPVPWAHTQRDEKQRVYFYVSPNYSLDDFLGDWTAPHEISHLSIPFLGKENSWFAEGYASYMQYQVMEGLGVYSDEEIQQMYIKKMSRVKPFYNTSSSLVSVAKDLRREYKFPEMYWGSATYFYKLDKKLKDKGSSLVGLINEYLRRYRLSDNSIEELLRSWDKIIGSPIASELFDSYNSLPAYEMIEVNED